MTIAELVSRVRGLAPKTGPLKREAPAVRPTLTGGRDRCAPEDAP